MNMDDAVDFAIRSAREAYDQRESFEDPVGSYRDNVIDTMNEHGAVWYVVSAALDVFNAEACRLFGNITFNR